MFKIISKKRYDELMYERSNYIERAAMLEEAVAAANERNKELKIKIHDCDEFFCGDCVHAIKRQTPIFRIETRCDLDRKCKDYKQKETVKMTLNICEDCIHKKVCYHIEHYGEDLEPDDVCEDFEEKRVNRGWKEENNKKTCSGCGFTYYGEEFMVYCPGCGATMNGKKE